MSINGIQIGPQTSDQKIQSAKWLEFEYLPNGDPDVLVQRNYPAGGSPSPAIPVYQIRIDSTSMDDWGEHIIELSFEFDDYGSAPANARRWLINAQIEYCLVQNWDAPGDFWAAFVVGHKPMNIQYVYYQYPCNYGATYTAKVLEKSGVLQSNQTLPDFVKIDSRSGYMTVYTDDLDNLGWYVIEVTATLDVIDNLGTSYVLDPGTTLKTTQSFSEQTFYSKIGDTTRSQEEKFLNKLLYDGYPLADDDSSASPSTHIGDGNANARYDGKTKIYGSDNPPPGFIYESKFHLTLGII